MSDTYLQYLIKCEFIPIKYKFLFLLDSLEEARKKLKKTKITSDLSTIEEFYTRIKVKNTSTISDPPIYVPKHIRLVISVCFI